MAKSKSSKTTKAKATKTTVKKQVNKGARSKAAPVNLASMMGTVTPYLAVNDARGAIAWYKDVFNAKVIGDIAPAGDKVMHATLKIGDSLVMMSDIFPGTDMVDAARAGASVNLAYYKADADKIWDRLVAKGAKVTMPYDDQFWGDKFGKVLDPFGHSWSVSRKSKLSKTELEALRVAAMKQFGA